MPAYPGDFDGPLDPSYHPEPDGAPDPGEVVWARVPYEEDATQGKDRPVLVLGWEGDWVLGLYLTGKDHDRDHEQERHAGRIWVDIGSGGWDSKGRPSEARVNRVVRIDPATIRREGAVLERARWDDVMAARRGLGAPESHDRGVLPG
ncbi:MAG: type II toxin-antitoxin system PemK/MazF family toxin [Knoellia sp.]